MAMPPDFQYGLPQVPAPQGPRTSAFVPASRLLMRETHGGPRWPAAAMVSFFALMVAAWTAALAAAYRRVGTAGPRPPRQARSRQPGPAREARPRASRGRQRI